MHKLVSIHSPILKITITDTEMHALENAITENRSLLDLWQHYHESSEGHVQDEIFEKLIQKAKNIVTRHLPQKIQDAIGQFTNEEHPLMVLDNFPVDIDLDMQNDDQDFLVAKTILMGITALCGEQVSYIDGQNGDMFSHITPREEDRKLKFDTGSEVTLAYHQEKAFFPFGPDQLILYGIREDAAKDCITSYICNTDVIQDLDKKTLEELKQPQYYIQLPPYYQERGLSLVGRPLINGNAINLAEHVDITCDSESGRQALEQLKDTVARHTRGVHMTPGRLLILNNRQTMHGRSIIHGSQFKGKDRLLLRTYSIRNDVFQHAREHHMLQGQRVFKTLDTPTYKAMVHYTDRAKSAHL